MTSAKRKESQPPKSASPAPDEVRTSSTPHLPPKKKIDWNSFTSKSECLNATAAEMQLDAVSREGVNVHVASYFYSIDGWPLIVPRQLYSCVLRGISKTQIDGSAGHASQLEGFRVAGKALVHTCH